MEVIQISLAAARVNADLSQKEAAEKIGVAPVTLSRWEKGEAIPWPWPGSWRSCTTSRWTISACPRLK